MEIQSITSNSDYSVYIRNYKNGIDSYKKRLSKLKESHTSKRHLDAILIMSETQREKLIHDDVAWNQLEKLEGAKRATLDIIQTGNEIGRELHSQTEKMGGIKEKLNSMNDEIDNSNSIIRRMMRRENRNKAIIAVFSIGLIIVFLIIMYFKLLPADTKESD
jgi:hypothetical protein